ncbi:unnamed protein product [Rhodiola kirilowii]
MPDTRISAIADSLTSLSASFADLAARTQTVESSIAAEAAKAAAETARNTSTFERVLGMLDQLNTTVTDIQLTTRHAGKQPMQAPNVTINSSPSSQYLGQLVFGSYGSPHRASAGTAQPLAIENNHMTNHRIPRVEVPTFTGEGVEGWVFQLNRFFTHYAVPHDQRLMIATFHTAGEALKWVQWLYTTQQQLDWEGFATRITARFGPPAYYSAEAMINRLFHTGSVSTYIDEFETLSTRTPGLSEENLRHRFIAGLKDDIHSEIVMFNPTTLHQAMGLARLAEQKLHTFRPRLMPPRPVPRPLA